VAKGGYGKPAAAERLRELMGDGAPSQHTLPALPIPYDIVNGRAIYQDKDLRDYANAKKKQSVRRMGGRRRSVIDTKPAA
jgi:hypothetical protein